MKTTPQLYCMSETKNQYKYKITASTNKCISASGRIKMQQKKRIRVLKIGIVWKPKSQVCGSMWKRKRVRERINESNTDNVIKVFFYSSSCYIISAALTSCQGLGLLDNCVHFSHRADSKGLLFSNNTIFLSRDYRRSHGHEAHKHTHVHADSHTNKLAAIAHIAHILTYIYL